MNQAQRHSGLYSSNVHSQPAIPSNGQRGQQKQDTREQEIYAQMVEQQAAIAHQQKMSITAGGKICKTHAKYFSQQNSPVNRSATAQQQVNFQGKSNPKGSKDQSAFEMVQPDRSSYIWRLQTNQKVGSTSQGKTYKQGYSNKAGGQSQAEKQMYQMKRGNENKKDFHLHPATTQNQSSAGYIASGQAAYQGSQSRIEYVNATNPSMYSNQNSGGHTDSQTQLQGGFSSVQHQKMAQLQKQSNPTTSDLVRRSISSSDHMKSNNQQNQQNYNSLSRFQGNSNQIKNQLPSKYSNSSTNYQHYEQNYGVKQAQNLGGRLSVGASRSSSNHHSVQNAAGPHPTLHGEAQVHSNSHQHQYPSTEQFQQSHPQFGVPTQPSQQYAKQYHSTNQTPIISNTAGNQTVATNNSIHSIMSNQNGINYQSSQAKPNNAKMKQKYDEVFLNGPITEQQTLNYQDDLDVGTNSSAHNLANLNAKRYMQHQAPFEQQQQTMHKKSMTQANPGGQPRSNTTLSNYPAQKLDPSKPNSIYQLSKAEMRLQSLNQPKQQMKNSKNQKNQQKFIQQHQSIDKIAQDIFQRSVVNPNLNSTNPNELFIQQEGGIVSAQHTQIKQQPAGTMSIKNKKRQQKAQTRPASNHKNKQYALQNLIHNNTPNEQIMTMTGGGQTLSNMSQNVQVTKFDLKNSTTIQGQQQYNSKTQHNSLTRHSSNGNYHQPQHLIQNTMHVQPNKKLKSQMGFDQASGLGTVDFNNRQGSSPNKIKRQSPTTLIVPQNHMIKPSQLMGQQHGNYIPAQGQYNQILHSSTKNQSYSNVIGTAQQNRMQNQSANILSKYNNNLHTLYNHDQSKKPGQPHSTSHMMGPGQNSAATIVGAGRGQTTLTTLTSSQKLIAHAPGFGQQVLSKQQMQQMEQISQLQKQKQQFDPKYYYEIDNNTIQIGQQPGMSGRQSHKKQNSSQANISDSNNSIQYIIKQPSMKDRKQSMQVIDEQALRMQQKNQQHHQRQMSQGMQQKPQKQSTRGQQMQQNSSRRQKQQASKSALGIQGNLGEELDVAAEQIPAQSKNNITLNYGGPPMMTGAGNILIQQTINKNSSSNKVVQTSGVNSSLGFNNKSITISHNQDDPAHYQYNDNQNGAYPYKSSTTKSGKVMVNSSSTSSQTRKQPAPQANQAQSSLSIAQIFQQKGLNYKGPSKIAAQQANNNTQKIIKYKMNANGVIVHTKGQAGKGSLTTSANTAVNTAQNSPRVLMNKNSLYIKNQQTTNLNSSQRRKPSTAVSVAASSSHHQAQHSMNSNSRPGTQKQTKHPSSKSPTLQKGAPSSNHQSTERLKKQRSKSNVGSSKATPKQNRGDPDEEEYQSLRNSIHGKDQDQNKKNNFVKAGQYHPLHHQFLDGGTGSNPNLLSNVNINSNIGPQQQKFQQRQEFGYHQQPLPSKYVKSSNEAMPDALVQQQRASAAQAINSATDNVQFNERIGKDEFLALKNDLEGMPDGPLMTEEEEHEIRQVASDINEKAFFGKIIKTKQIIQASKQDASQMSKLSPRSQEIAYVMKKIEESFAKSSDAPESELPFYRIGKMLGRGAFGKVNLAMHKLVRKLVALKSLNKECLTDSVQKQKLMKEVNLLLKLRHEHVVKIYETIETKKHIIIVMELCAGGDLLNYVRKRRRLKEPYAKKIFKQIIDGLNYIHSKYIAHRDIKLDNILLDGKGSVKIADFGVSKQSQPGVKMREQCGTPAYIAPEILKNKNGYTFNVDLWSAGVVLFAMLYGTVPFKAASIEELHSLILRGIYTLKDDISQEARDMLRGLLEINPHKRLTIQQILEHPWLKDYDESLQLFNDQERDMIKKEYTYNDPRRYNRNDDEEPIDCFTEHNIDSVYNTMKNCSDKSIILAPFNSTQSEDMEVFKKQIKNMIVEKQVVLRLSRLCREIDRQYEFNNNGQLDNGVYHKQIVNTQENKSQDSKKKDKKKSDDSDDEDDELKFQVIQCSKSQGMEFLTEDYQNENQKKESKEQFIKNMMSNLTDAERALIESTFGTNKEMEIDEPKIDTLVQYGYPKDYILQSLQNNEANYLTAGYYLLKMDQNYC